eukprot:gene10437-2959_t
MNSPKSKGSVDKKKEDKNKTKENGKSFDIPSIDIKSPKSNSDSELSRSSSGSFTRTKSGTILSRVSSRYKSSEMAKKKFHVNHLGEVIYKNHESFGLMKQIQMGLKSVVDESFDSLKQKKKDLTIQDFGERTKLPFPKEGSEKTPAHDFDNYIFYTYAGPAFENLRERFSIQKEHFLFSLCHEKSLAIIGTPGKSGSLFFFSLDMQYIIKTITKKESKTMREMLPEYYNHAMSHSSTLINRFYGMYSIKSKDNQQQNVRFIIMNNVFDTPFKVNFKYDLKGSTIGRSASEKELQRETPIYKDLDIKTQQKKIKVGPEMKKKILAQLKADCDWLAKNQIMDYSLLLGIHKIGRKGTTNKEIIEEGLDLYGEIFSKNDLRKDAKSTLDLERVKEDAKSDLLRELRKISVTEIEKTIEEEKEKGTTKKEFEELKQQENGTEENGHSSTETFETKESEVLTDGDKVDTETVETKEVLNDDGTQIVETTKVEEIVQEERMDRVAEVPDEEDLSMNKVAEIPDEEILPMDKVAEISDEEDKIQQVVSEEFSTPKSQITVQREETEEISGSENIKMDNIDSVEEQLNSFLNVKKKPIEDTIEVKLSPKTRKAQTPRRKHLSSDFADNLKKNSKEPFNIFKIEGEGSNNSLGVIEDEKGRSRSEEVPKVNVPNEDDDSSDDEYNKPRAKSKDTLVPEKSHGVNKALSLRGSMMAIFGKSGNSRFSEKVLFGKSKNHHEQFILMKNMGSSGSEFQKIHGGILSDELEDGTREIYFFGIIDLLQKWNSKKQLENLFKGMVEDKKKISAVNPTLYAKRFYEFIEDLLE